MQPQRTSRPDPLAAARESVWTLAFAPALWAVHFLACYVLAAVWCARAGRAAPLGEARGWIALLSALALLALLWLGAKGWRRYRHGAARSTHGDSDADRHRFLGLVALLLSGLAAVAVVYEALTVLLIGSCA